MTELNQWLLKYKGLLNISFVDSISGIPLPMERWIQNILSKNQCPNPTRNLINNDYTYFSK